MITPVLDGVRRVVLVGAHCDDIAIGAGATVLALARSCPDLDVSALVLTGGGGVREDEERRALDALAPQGLSSVEVLDLPDGRLPEHRSVVKDALQAAAAGGADLVLGPQAHDAHQDHRLLGEMVPTAFRDCLHLGYEILKWESDLPRTVVYIGVTEELAREKVRVVTTSYPSQRAHDWFDEEAFTALLRVRGAQCHQRYAEAFCVDKLVLSAAGPQA